MDIEKQNSVPIWKRAAALLIDFCVLSMVISILPIDVETQGISGTVLFLSVYLSYFSISTYSCQSTLGLYLFNIKIKFDNNNFLFLRILSREVLFITIGTGIGLLFYLFKGPYWDKVTKASIVWRKKDA